VELLKERSEVLRRIKRRKRSLSFNLFFLRYIKVELLKERSEVLRRIKRSLSFNLFFLRYTFPLQL